MTSSEMGGAAATKPPPGPETDPDVRNYGPPPESHEDPESGEGSSGADEGISPWSSQADGEEPEGPTTSTED